MKQTIRFFGWDLHRYQPSSDPHAQLSAAIKYAGINVIFDIGANIGQFALDLRSVGYKGKIVSFEPLSSAHSILSKNARLDTNWLLHPKAAIGEKEGTTEINISGNSVSSSILPMLDSHSSAANDSAYINREKVNITRIDTISDQYLDRNSSLFLKIDTQGYEWQVLDGAIETIDKANGILIELSLVTLYKDQKLWLEIINRLEESGFRLWTLQQGFTDPRNGQSLQMDAIFLRKKT